MVVENYAISIAHFIEDWLERNKKTENALAKAAGIKWDAISKLKHKENSRITLEIVLRISKATEVPLIDIITYERE